VATLTPISGAISKLQLKIFNSTNNFELNITHLVYGRYSYYAFSLRYETFANFSFRLDSRKQAGGNNKHIYLLENEEKQ